MRSFPLSNQLPVSQAAGTGTLVAASSNAGIKNRIKVMAAFLVASAASTVNLQSHTTTANATGAISLSANGGLVLPYNPDGWFTTTLGEALDIVVGGTGPVVGSINYCVV